MNPRIFIGSSAESLDPARALQEQLHRDADVTIWYEVLGRPSRNTLHALIDTAKSSDFGIFVFAPDDSTRSRSAEEPSPRDNVIFEYGLFLGVLGPERTFIVSPLDTPVKMPSDLYGTTIAQYKPSDDATLLQSALGPAASAIRKELTRLGARAPRDFQEIEEYAVESQEVDSRYIIPLEDHRYIVDAIAASASTLCADLAGKGRVRRSAPFKNYNDKCVYARLFLKGAGDVGLDFYLQRLVNDRAEILVQFVLRPGETLKREDRVDRIYEYDATVRDTLETICGFVRAEKQRRDGLPRWIVPERTPLRRNGLAVSVTARYIADITRGLLATTPFSRPRYGKT